MIWWQRNVKISTWIVHLFNHSYSMCGFVKFDTWFVTGGVFRDFMANLKDMLVLVHGFPGSKRFGQSPFVPMTIRSGFIKNDTKPTFQRQITENYQQHLLFFWLARFKLVIPWPHPFWWHGVAVMILELMAPAAGKVLEIPPGAGWWCRGNPYV